MDDSRPSLFLESFSHIFAKLLSLLPFKRVWHRHFGKPMDCILLSSGHILSWLFLNFNILDQQYLSKSYLNWLYLRRRPISYIIPLKSSATVAADTLCECRSRTKVRPWKVEKVGKSWKIAENIKVTGCRHWLGWCLPDQVGESWLEVPAKLQKVKKTKKLEQPV